MNYIKLYNGINMPILGFGTARIQGDTCIHAVSSAIELGYTLIDTANMYNNEAEIGKAISNYDRGNLFITTKLCSETKSYDAAINRLNQSLKDLNTTYLDLVLIHEPFDEDIEVYRALEDYYNKGIIKAIGVSNFTIDYLKSFITKVNIKPMVHQVECHPYYQQHDMEEYLKSENIAMQAYAPFISGDTEIINDEALVAIALNHNKSVHQVILNYLANRNIAVIAKTINANRMLDNLNIFDFKLSSDEIAIIDSLNRNKSYYGWDE